MCCECLQVCTAASTAKNPLRLQVYYVAKQCSSRCSAEEYAIALGRHFVKTYPKVRFDFLWCWLSELSHTSLNADCCCPAGDQGKGVG